MLLPKGLRAVDASDVSLVGLGEGAQEAQARQKAEAEALGLPLMIRHEKTGIEFVYIPSGEFMMGSENGDDDESPVREIVIANGFYLARTEVTQRQWEVVAKDDPSRFKGGQLPVEQVSWDYCRLFCQVGRFRLPTEEEWEYACRAGTAEPTGESLDNVAWHDGNSGRKTHAVAQKKPNAWGLYDMHGNVHEWCQDIWNDYGAPPVEFPEDSEERAKAIAKALRVFRGGSWLSEPKQCRSADRNRFTPSHRRDNLGFRVVLPIAIEEREEKTRE